MPRRSRETSGTGIYHVMLRGINRQNIFYDIYDYELFFKLLRKLTHPEDERHQPLPPHCVDDKRRRTDEEVSQLLISEYGLKHPQDMLLLNKERQQDAIKLAKDFGASIRQIERLTGLSFYTISKN